MDDDHYGKVREERHGESCFEIVVGHCGIGHPDEASAAPERANACRRCAPLEGDRPTSCSLAWRESHSERSGVVSEPVHTIGHSLHISSAKVLDQGRPCAIASPAVLLGLRGVFRQRKRAHANRRGRHSTFPSHCRPACILRRAHALGKCDIELSMLSREQCR